MASEHTDEIFLSAIRGGNLERVQEICYSRKFLQMLSRLMVGEDRPYLHARLDPQGFGLAHWYPIKAAIPIAVRHGQIEIADWLEEQGFPRQFGVTGAYEWEGDVPWIFLFRGYLDPTNGVSETEKTDLCPAGIKWVEAREAHFPFSIFQRMTEEHMFTWYRKSVEWTIPHARRWGWPIIKRPMSEKGEEKIECVVDLLYRAPELIRLLPMDTAKERADIAEYVRIQKGGPPELDTEEDQPWNDILEFLKSRE